MGWCFDCLGEIEKEEELAKRFWEHEKMGQEFQAFTIIPQLEQESTGDDKPMERNDKSFDSDDDSMESEDNDDLENVTIEYQIMNKRVKCISDIKEVFRNELDVIKTKRQQALRKLDMIKTINKELVQHASQCHLRYNYYRSLEKPNQDKSDKLSEQRQAALDAMRRERVTCELCACDHSISNYAKHLFTNVEIINYRRTKKHNDPYAEADSDDSDDYELNSTVDYRTGSSDLEKFLKILVAFVRKYDNLLQGYSENGRQHVEIFKLFKEEIKLMSTYWTNASNEVNAYDELEMSKSRVRLMLPNETNPFRIDNLIHPDHAGYMYKHYLNEEKVIKTSLEKKLGQLLFLKNSLKVSVLILLLFLKILIR